MSSRPPEVRASFALEGELVIDNFAGGGGASTGIESALGRPVDIAINHSAAAIAVHRRNHPETKHYQEDIWTVDPKEACGGRPVGLAWFSPDCTHHSRARGGKPREHGIRALAWVVIRWAKAVHPRVILLENVEEFEEWGPLDDEGQPIKERVGETFREWLGALSDCGYSIDFRSLVAADYGAPTTRKRLFLVARRDGGAIVWPDASHGRGRPEPWHPAAEVIDWSLPCPSIFDRKKPLAEATLRRIAAGIKRYVIECSRPFVVPLTHQGGDRVHSIDEPLRTVTGAHRGELAIVNPFLAQVSHGDWGYRDGSRCRGLDDPLGAVTGSNDHALIAPTLITTGYGEKAGQGPRVPGLGKPLGTVVACGAKHALVAAFLARHNTGVVGRDAREPLATLTSKNNQAIATAWMEKLYTTARGASLEEPVPTITAGGGHLAQVVAFFVRYYGSGGQWQGADQPLRTVTTKARFGLVMVEGAPYVITDIGMRMLQPRELFLAQGFPGYYEIDPDLDGRPLTKTEQIALAGNAVCPPVAEALVAANILGDRPAHRGLPGFQQSLFA